MLSMGKLWKMLGAEGLIVKPNFNSSAIFKPTFIAIQ